MGVFNPKRSLDDELMLLNLAKTNRRNPNEKLIIFDARSQINALANRLNNDSCLGFSKTSFNFSMSCIFFKI